MTEDYTGPRRCDLCEDEKKAPCPGEGCNSVNNLKNFRPKGSGKEGSGWEIISFCWDKSDDHIIINLKSNEGCVIMVTLSPDNIADLGLAR